MKTNKFFSLSKKILLNTIKFILGFFIYYIELKHESRKKNPPMFVWSNSLNKMVVRGCTFDAVDHNG